jgi:two-component system, NarL family, response regulator NreC
LPVKVIIADDHQIVRQCLKALLETEGFAVIGEAANGQEALKLVEALQPDVAVLDLAMPLLNGIEAARQIQSLSPQTKPILLTMHTDNQYILEGLRSGAKGYVMKTNAAAELVRAVREAVRGGTYVSPTIAEAVVQAYQNKTEIVDDPLSGRERQVLQLIAEGKITKEVASMLGISVKTAETYRSRIMEKLDLHITADLVRYAVRRGIVQA